MTINSTDVSPVFAFGLVAFGFLGMGPGHDRGRLLRPGHRQRAVGLRAVVHRGNPGHQGQDQRRVQVRRRLREGQAFFLEENDGAGNTFKATAKPVLIGTAVAYATTTIFSIIALLTIGPAITRPVLCSPFLHLPFPRSAPSRRGSASTGSTGASTQAASTGAYTRAVEFIKANIKPEGAVAALDRGQQEGRRDLHAARAKVGCVQHLPRHLLRDARARLHRCRASPSVTSSRSRPSGCS